MNIDWEFGSRSQIFLYIHIFLKQHSRPNCLDIGKCRWQEPLECSIHIALMFDWNIDPKHNRHKFFHWNLMEPCIHMSRPKYPKWLVLGSRHIYLHLHRNQHCTYIYKQRFQWLQSSFRDIDKSQCIASWLHRKQHFLDISKCSC